MQYQEVMYFSLMEPHRNGLLCRELCEKPNSKEELVLCHKLVGRESYAEPYGQTCVVEVR